jgi:UDP-glucose 4-epimerase
VTEDTAFDLTNAGHVYTASKIGAELVATSYGDLYQQPYTILRYGIPYGPRMREELVIPRFVRAAIAGEKITIQGDGLQYRNYVYVEDLADAHVLALGKAGENQTFNLEGPEQVSIRRIAEVVREQVNPDLEIEFVPARPGDYAGRPVSADRARKIIGWEAATSFDEGMRRYLDWWPPERENSDERAGEA